MEEIWIKGRAFIFEDDKIEYFHRFEKNNEYIRSFCGNLRLAKKCKALDYIQEHPHLKF